MNKYLVTIALLLLVLVNSSPAQARLTLGVVTGADDLPGTISIQRAESLAAQLAEKLQEEVVVKTFDNSATLVSWLDRFATLDLALLTAGDVGANPGRLLLLGEQGDLRLVSRQGAVGDLPQRVSSIILDIGFTHRTVRETAASPAPEAPLARPLAVEPEPQKASVYCEIRPLDKTVTRKLVFGVVPDTKGLLQTVQQAENLAAYLEKVLPVSVKVREFSSMETLAEWFMRYCIVDLAILPSDVPGATLGRNYQPIAKLLRTDRPGEGSAELLVLRRGQHEEIREPLQRALLQMSRETDGKKLMAALRISDIALPGTIGGAAPVVALETVPGIETLELPAALTAEAVDKAAAEQLPPTTDYAEPEQPRVPAAVVDVPLPQIPQVAAPASLAPLPGPPADALTLPAATRPPVSREPVVEANLPSLPAVAQVTLAAPLSEPPPLPSVEVPSTPQPATPDLAPAALPAAPPVPVVEAEAPLLLDTPVVAVPGQLPGAPVLAAEAPVAQADVVNAPVMPVVPPEAQQAPALSVVVPDAPAPVAVPEAPVLAAAPAVPNEVAVTAPVMPVAPLDAPQAPALPVVVSAAPAPVAVPETPVMAAAPIIPQEAAVTVPVESPEAPPVPADIVPIRLPETKQAAAVPVLAGPVATPGAAQEPVAKSEPPADEQQKIIEEVLQFAEAVPSYEAGGATPVAIPGPEALPEEELVAMLGEDTVASMVAQPQIPQELRPSGVPVIRPGRVTRSTKSADDTQLVAAMPEPLKQVEPPRLPQLLPEPEPEPGLVYVVPFVSVMVPTEVNARVFDQFVDILNQKGTALGFQFVILKEGLQRVAPQWLAVRKYVTGEIYAYVEDSGSNWTELRTKARMTYKNPGKDDPVGFEYPVKGFFEHDRSTLDAERIKLADQIASTLANELLKSLQN